MPPLEGTSPHRRRRSWPGRGEPRLLVTGSPLTLLIPGSATDGTICGKAVYFAPKTDSEEGTMPRMMVPFSFAAVVAAGLVSCSSSSSPSSPLSAVASPRFAIAFSAGASGGVQDIYVIRTDGSGLRRLTHGSAKEFTPSWSPDGRWIAPPSAWKRRERRDLRHPC